MYNFNTLVSIHVELSSNCQASCPMCARNHHGGVENPILKVSDITLEEFKMFCPEYVLKQVHVITMCGNFGDPIVNKDLYDIVEYIAVTNPNIKIDLHTNGSARTTEWWGKLAKIMPKKHLVQFGIDGLEDTHALYRVGTSFNKIIENAKAFINAGGVARWNFITFKHNEHQLETARQMARELGFEGFYEKQTSRFIGTPHFDVLDKSGNVTHKLELPTEQKIVFIDKKTVENYKAVIKTATIKCEVEETKSVYIDALGYLWPCCFVGAVPYIHTRPEQLVHNYQQDSYASLMAVLDRFGGIEQFNIRNRSIQEIINSTEWQTVWDDVFANNELMVCARVCGKFPEKIISQCRDQFVELENFNE